MLSEIQNGFEVGRGLGSGDALHTLRTGALELTARLDTLLTGGWASFGAARSAHPYQASAAAHVTHNQTLNQIK